MEVTILTPAYNRAGLLPRLYQSLLAQTVGGFEWLVVDDGSTDDTEAVVAQFIAEGRLPVRYVKKANGGKHTAVNMGVAMARGRLVFIADSDDWLLPDAIEAVVEAYAAVKGDPSFAGVCGLDCTPSGQIVGSGLPADVIDTTAIEIRDRYRVAGDLKEVFRADVLRQFQFPEIPGERFCPEALAWNRIATRYRLRYFNRPIYVADYQPDGITSSITRARMLSPVAAMMTYAEWYELPVSLAAKVKMAINYWRFAMCARRRDVKIASWGKLLAPVGWLLHFKDKRTIAL